MALETNSKSRYHCLFTRICNKETKNATSLRGGTLPSDANAAPFNSLFYKLALIGLKPLDVGGFGDCFFKAVSHHLYGKPDLHYQIRIAGIEYLNEYPDLFIESIPNNSWQNYIDEMSKQGAWCDNIIIQAVANALNCIIHITESNLNSIEATA